MWGTHLLKRVSQFNSCNLFDMPHMAVPLLMFCLCKQRSAGKRQLSTARLLYPCSQYAASVYSYVLLRPAHPRMVLHPFAKGASNTAAHGEFQVRAVLLDLFHRVASVFHRTMACPHPAVFSKSTCTYTYAPAMHPSVKAALRASSRSRLDRRRGAARRVSAGSDSARAYKGVWLDQRMQRSEEKHAGSSASDLALQHIRVVAVAPKHASNVGAIVRACENFECPNLHIVQPRCDVYCDEVLKLACGSALVSHIVVHDSLQAALSECSAAVALTRRSIATRPPAHSWAELAPSIPYLASPPVPAAMAEPTQAAAAGAGSRPLVAVVFGREESGLTAAEALQCSHACGIPTGRLQPSLNLSHAAAVILSRIYEDVICELSGNSAHSAPQHAAQRPALPGKIEAPAAAEPAGDSPRGSESGAALAAAVGRLSSHSHSTRDGGGAAAQHPAQHGEVQALVARWQNIAEAVGTSGELTRGGGAHGRKLTEVGHLAALLSAAAPNTTQIRAMHALARRVEARVLPATPPGVSGTAPRRRQDPAVLDG
eukprot:jgi/Ulvmu1/1946/UM012_0107.1